MVSNKALASTENSCIVGDSRLACRYAQAESVKETTISFRPSTLSQTSSPQARCMSEKATLSFPGLDGNSSSSNGLKTTGCAIQGRVSLKTGAGPGLLEEVEDRVVVFVER